jgi:hypothetical protein
MSTKLLTLSVVLTLAVTVGGQKSTSQSDTNYGLAFASFAPLNTDIFIAEADGRDPHVPNWIPTRRR